MAGNNTYHTGAWISYSYEYYQGIRKLETENKTLECSCCKHKPNWGVYRQVLRNGTGVYLCPECNNQYATKPHTITLIGAIEVVSGNQQGLLF